MLVVERVHLLIAVLRLKNAVLWKGNAALGPFFVAFVTFMEEHNKFPRIFRTLIVDDG